MKKIIVAALALVFAASLMVNAQDTTAPAPKAKKELTTEQQAVMKDMLAKYDANKDGKLDKTERAAMSQADQDTMIKAGLMKAKKPAGAASTNAPAAAPGN